LIALQLYWQQFAVLDHRFQTLKKRNLWKVDKSNLDEDNTTNLCSSNSNFKSIENLCCSKTFSNPCFNHRVRNIWKSFKKFFFLVLNIFFSLSTKQLGRVISRSNKIYRRGEKAKETERKNEWKWDRESERERDITNRIWLKKSGSQKSFRFLSSSLGLLLFFFSLQTKPNFFSHNTL